jgi:hypothetical protein
MQCQIRWASWLRRTHPITTGRAIERSAKALPEHHCKSWLAVVVSHLPPRAVAGSAEARAWDGRGPAAPRKRRQDLQGQLLEEALARTHGNRTHAAGALGRADTIDCG